MKNERRLFFLLLLLETAVFVWMVLSRRMPRGHDTLGLYLMQYLFLAHAASTHTVALWMPNTAHGLLTNWSASNQGGLFQNAVLFLGGVPAGTNNLPVFYAGMFVDELILLVGIWRLGRHYYADPRARFFVAVAAIGSTFWINHPVFNFRSFYSLPLLLAFLHDLLQNGRRGPLFLAALLAALQFTGGTPYVPIFTLFVALLYFVVHALVFRIRAASLRPRPVDALIVLVAAGLLAVLFTTLRTGAGEFRLFRLGRNPDGSVPLDQFLTYGGTLSPIRYLDFFLGLSPSLDYTLYCGMLTLACAVIGVFHRPGKTVAVLSICLLLVLLFSTGFLSLVAATAYQLVPPLHYFRYVALTAPLVKLFLILLSGFGVEALLSRQETLRQRITLPARGLLLAAILMGALTGLVPAGDGMLTRINEVLRTSRLGLALRTAADAPSNALPLLGASTVAAAAAGILLLLRARRAEAAPVLLATLMALHVADLYRWKLQMTVQESVVLEGERYVLHRIEPVPYIPRRSADYEAPPRSRALKVENIQHGAIYDFTDPFLGIDPPQTRFMRTYWLAPFDALLAASEGRPLEGKITADPRLRVAPNGPYAAVTGTTVDKLQVFRRAHVASDQTIASILNKPGFRGDALLLSGPAGPGAAPLSNDRLDLPCTVVAFDFDAITVKIDVPQNETEAWLMYADVWHPGWKATVNGRPATVERAFLAYKAVRLSGGGNVVEFRFHDPVRSWCYRAINLASLLFVVVIVVLTVQLIRGRPGP